jgi:acetate kinase
VRVLVVNAGSSSLKLSLIGDEDQTLGELELRAPGARVDEAELRSALATGLDGCDVVAHRIVHGGERFTQAVRLDATLERDLRALTELAPLHQPKSLAALDAVSAALPNLPAVACFDTAFHRSLPAAATTYALPARWRERWGVRRYGFHGLSHSWVARRAVELLDGPESGLRIVSCHLGAGASLCAIRDGASIDTTMGFTPLEGLVMATRSGSVDPGLLLWLLEDGRLSEPELAEGLEHGSGLLGLGGSSDMREILRRSDAGDGPAALALDVYLHRLRAGIAATAAAVGGLDALVFTGGVGENAAAVRSGAVDGLGFLGLAVDQSLNSASGGDREIGHADSSARLFVVRAREDLEMVRQTRELLS